MWCVWLGFSDKIQDVWHYVHFRGPSGNGEMQGCWKGKVHFVPGSWNCSLSKRYFSFLLCETCPTYCVTMRRLRNLRLSFRICHYCQALKAVCILPSNIKLEPISRSLIEMEMFINRKTSRSDIGEISTGCMHYEEMNLYSNLHYLWFLRATHLFSNNHNFQSVVGIDESDQEMCWSAEADLGTSCFSQKQPHASSSKTRSLRDGFIFALQSRITSVSFKKNFCYELENDLAISIIKMINDYISNTLLLLVNFKKKNY